MRILFTKLLFLSIIFLSIISCDKESIYPSDDYPKGNPESYYLWENDTSKKISLWGKFLIIDAVMYVENHETGQKIKFHHFGPNKNKSSLRWGGSEFEIENIEKNKTTYSFYSPINFPGTGKFILNDDITKHYGINIMGWNKTIVEDPVYGMGQQLLGGVSKPFSGQILNYDEKTIIIQIQEAEGSINGYNCKYITHLTLKKIQEW